MPRLRLRCAVLFAVIPLGLVACSTNDAQPSSAQDVAAGQLTFATPEDAVVALIDGARTGDLARVEPLFGPGAAELASSDPDQTEGDLQRLAAAYDRKHMLFAEGTEGVQGGGPVVLTVGEDDWTFPVPLVPVGSGSEPRWRFDTATGIANVQALRLEANTDAAVQLLRDLIEAQEQFRQLGTLGVPAYAKRLRSEPGTRNGLWWPNDLAPPVSPVGPMVDDAVQLGRIEPGADVSSYRGYRYRILTSAGPSAPGGAANWLDPNGQLVGGFAFLAWPVAYGETGVSTILVSMDGQAWLRDFGDATESDAAAIVTFDPGEGWVERVSE